MDLFKFVCLGTLPGPVPTFSPPKDGPLLPHGDLSHHYHMGPLIYVAHTSIGKRAVGLPSKGFVIIFEHNRMTLHERHIL